MPKPLPSSMARIGNTNSGKRISDADVRDMRHLYHDHMYSVAQVQAAYPHVSKGYVLKVLDGTARQRLAP